MGTQKLLLNIGMVFLSLSLASTIYLGPYARSMALQKEHSQAFLGVVIILMGLLQPYMCLSAGIRRALAWLLVTGALLVRIGVSLQLIIKALWIIPMLGSVIVAISVLVYGISIWRYTFGDENGKREKSGENSGGTAG